MKLHLELFPPEPGAYLVGGCVRDLLIGRTPTDYDVAVLGDPAAYARSLAAPGGRVVVIGKADFRIWRVVSKIGAIDVAPIGGGTIAEDLRRRDFTINAMAMETVTSQIIDVTGGRRDLDAGTVRMVSAEAFRNDPVRLVRAFRFAAGLGFAIDPQTRAAIRRDARLIAAAAGERIREEWFKLLAADGAQPHVAAMAESGLLAAVFPQLEGLSRAEMRRRQQTLLQLERFLDMLSEFSATTAEPMRRDLTGRRRVLAKFAVLLPENAGPAAERLRLSARDAEHLALMARNRLLPLSVCRGARTARDLTRFFRTAGSCLPELLLHSLAACLCGPGVSAAEAERFRGFVRESLEDYYFRYQPVLKQPRPLSGNDLIAELGMKPSPLFGRILDRIEEERLVRGGLTRAEAVEMAASFLKNGR
jgi:tRNA nucleotidyltransferase/poly(A) polymerase